MAGKLSAKIIIAIAVMALCAAALALDCTAGSSAHQDLSKGMSYKGAGAGYGRSIGAASDIYVDHFPDKSSLVKMKEASKRPDGNNYTGDLASDDAVSPGKRLYAWKLISETGEDDSRPMLGIVSGVGLSKDEVEGRLKGNRTVAGRQGESPFGIGMQSQRAGTAGSTGSEDRENGLLSGSAEDSDTVAVTELEEEGVPLAQPEDEDGGQGTLMTSGEDMSEESEAEEAEEDSDEEESGSSGSDNDEQADRSDDSGSSSGASEAGDHEEEGSGAGEEGRTDESGLSDEDEYYEEEPGTEESEEEEEEAAEATEFIYEGRDYTVFVQCSPDAMLPEGTTLHVEEIKKNTDEYEEYYQQTQDAVKEDVLSGEDSGKSGSDPVDDAIKQASAGQMHFARFFDITFEYEGEKIEPAEPVSVKITYDKAIAINNEDNIRILHFAVDGETGETTPEILDQEKVKTTVEKDKAQSSTDLTEAEFEAESFSVYAIVEIVDVRSGSGTGVLDGRSYGLISYSGDGVSGTAMMATAKNTSSLQGSSLPVRIDPVNHKDVLFVAKNSKITIWSFHSISDQEYYVTSESGDQINYLSIDGTAVSLVDNSEISDNCIITVEQGTGAYTGKIRFTRDGKVIYLTGGAFTATGVKKDNGWMSLAELSSLKEDDFVVYTSGKVSVSDPANVANGSQVIIYTRVWNDTTKSYEYYAIDHDGSLVRCYESGDTIQWVGSKVNTLLWEFTEYYYEGSKEANYYYDLQNTYSRKYIAPQIGKGQILSDYTIGINLNGRRYGDYYTTIQAWDDPYYDYAALKTENGELKSVPMADADTFYFAVMNPVEEKLTTVDTIDNNKYGITMKMQNYEYQGYFVNNAYRQKDQMELLGHDSNKDGLVTSDLDPETGYPNTVPSKTGKPLGSLQSLYSQARDVNHLFLKSTYEESGYFEYDCTKNFAMLNTTGENAGNFTVYNQLGTIDQRTHGQFQPYNYLTPGLFSSATNTTNELNEELSSLDPRKGEKLYKISSNSANNNKVKENQADYFFGMEMSASFIQNENGVDAWGHDLIFEFSGDDDFWLYVDGELVLDLGGVHSAEKGSINFHTGAVYMKTDGKNKKKATNNTTLRAVFEKNYKERNPGKSNAEVQEYLDGIFKDGGTVFNDYTSHYMKMFYMERGAGSSNLHMRFNLTPSRTGQVQLSKKISGTDKKDYVSAEFPFQIFYKNEQHNLVQLTDSSKVTLHETSEPVNYSAKAGNYEHVFYLKPGQTASIMLPDDDTEYYIKECYVNTEIYDSVKANENELEGESAGQDRGDFQCEPAAVNARKRVIFDNHVDPESLRTLTITKKLFDQSGNSISSSEDPTGFKFRVTLGERPDHCAYHVKDPSGYYCRYDNRSASFASVGTKKLADLSEEELKTITFTSSGNGAIDKIPADYSVEIRGLPVGMKFNVEEKASEIPDGYRLKEYVRDEGSYLIDEEGTVNSGTIREKTDPSIEVHNIRGWGLTAKKKWSDSSFMDSHDNIYFAVFVNENGRSSGDEGSSSGSAGSSSGSGSSGGNGGSSDASGSSSGSGSSGGNGGSTDAAEEDLKLVEGTLRMMRAEVSEEHPVAETSLYWYFDSLEDGKTFDQYVIREVQVEDPVTDENGYVTGYSSIRPAKEGETITVGGIPKGKTHSDGYEYIASYEAEKASGSAGNIRTTTVTNTRPGIRIMKTDSNGEPLSGAVFTLTDSEGRYPGGESYTSDRDGLITTAYLENGQEYTIEEKKTPSGYQAVKDTIKFKVIDKNNVTINGSAMPGKGYEITLGDIDKGKLPTITLINKAFTLKAVKEDADTNDPLRGVTFQLYRQVITSTGKAMRDYSPLSGYEALTTDENGTVPGITENLQPGSYYLHEQNTPTGYESIDTDLCFTISNAGIITINNADRKRWLSLKTESGTDNYTITIPNQKKKTVRILKKGTSAADIGGKGGSGGTDPGSGEILAGAQFELYNVTKLSGNDPAKGASPDASGTTGEDGLFELGYLVPGTYHLFEKEAPDGYMPLKEAVIITVTEDKIKASYIDKPLTTESVSSGKIVQITVWNDPGLELPATGGSGYRFGYMLGMLLILISGIALAWRKLKTVV